MYYYKFHISDYKSHTSHLTPIEDICYRRLLDWYFLHEKTIPNEIIIVARFLGLSEYSTSVEQVLNEFFTKTKSGWINKRADEEIHLYKTQKSSASTAGKISADKRKSYRQQPLNECTTTVEPTINHKPLTINHKETTTKAPAKQVHPPVGVSLELWADYMTLRKSKKSPMTATALKGLERESRKAGITLEAGITICVERNWVSLKAEWLDDKKLTVHQQQMQSFARTIGLGRQNFNLNEIPQTMNTLQLEDSDHEQF